MNILLWVLQIVVAFLVKGANANKGDIT